MIGSTLQMLLTDHNMNVNELSRLTGISAQTLYSIIKRDNMKIDFEVLLKICDVLDTEVEVFYHDYLKSRKREKIALSNSEHEHLQKYRRLNPIGKSRLNEQLNDMLSLEKYVSANSDSEIAQEITPINIYEPLTSDAEIDAEVEDYRRQLLEEREAAERSRASRDAKEA